MLLKDIEGLKELYSLLLISSIEKPHLTYLLQADWRKEEHTNIVWSVFFYHNDLSHMTELIKLLRSCYTRYNSGQTHFTFMLRTDILIWDLKGRHNESN